MPDYSLGRAHGRIDLTYDGTAARKAADDLDRLTLSALKAQLALRDMGREHDNAGNAAQRHSDRTRELHRHTQDLESTERNRIRTLRDSRDEIDRLHLSNRRLINSHNDHNNTVRHLIGSLGQLHNTMGGLHNMQNQLSGSTAGLNNHMGSLVGLLGLMGPQGRAASVGLRLLPGLLGQVGSSASSSSNSLGEFNKLLGGAEAGVKKLAGVAMSVGKFELQFAKISAMALGLPSLAGLAGLGGAAGVQGLVEVIDAVKQLSGVLGLLPAAISGAAFSMATLKIAFHGVGDAIKDMMADDPKKFLEDIAQMAPSAARSMLQVAQFRDMFKLAGGAVQESFFSKIAGDIAPLIQKWLPAVTSGMSQVAGIFGDFAHEFAGILSQPQAMAAFTSLIDGISQGLHALQPALGPLVNIFTTLVQVGSSFFGQIGSRITGFVQQFAEMVDGPAQKLTEALSGGGGGLQAWIQDGINAFGHLVGIIEHVGSAFVKILDISENFGGGGLLAWLEKVTAEFDNWAHSTDGQKTLTEFFSTLRTATDAFLPMLKPLVEGLASIGEAFVNLGIGIAPGWQALFDGFASSMKQLGPQIVAMAPALNTFLNGLATAFSQLMAQVGPQLPRIFQTLADAFVALLPQIGPLTDAFIRLIEQVGPQLPKLFETFTDLINSIVPHLPTLIELTREFVTVITALVGVMGDLLDGLSGFNDFILKDLPAALGSIKDLFGNVFNPLIEQAVDFGKRFVQNLIHGLTGGVSIGGITGALTSIAGIFTDNLLTKSPAKRGPLHDTSPNEMGQRIVTNLAAGVRGAQPHIEAAASSTAAAAAGALSGAAGTPFAAGMEGAGGALLPDNIAGADVSILDTYLRHEFSDGHGLKGLARDLGGMLNVFQSGAGIANYAQQALQTLSQLPGFNQQSWRKISAADFAKQQAEDLMRQAGQQGPQWGQVVPSAPGAAGHLLPIDVTAASSKEQIQQAIIAAGKGRGLDDAAIQTALAVAAAESGFNPTISGGVQGSAGLVSGLYQQSPSSGWGTLEQVNDPAYAINAFYNAYAQQLAKNPGNPLLAAVLTQNPQLGAGAQGSKYMQDVMAQLGLAKSIMDQPMPWAQFTGGRSSGVPTVGGLTSNILPLTPSGPLTHVDEAKGWVDGKGNVFSDAEGKNATGQTWRGPGKLSGGTPSGAGATATAPPLNLGELPNVRGAHPQLAYAMAAIQQLFPNAKLNAGKDDHGVDQGWHPRGQAIDIGAPGDDPQTLAAISNWLLQFSPNIEELIHSGPGVTQNIKSGKLGPAIDMPGSVYNSGQAGYHGDHVHLAITDQMAQAFEAAVTGQTMPPGAVSALGNRNLPLPSGNLLGQLVDSSGKTMTINQQQLQAYLQGNPALASQISAAQVPGAGDQTVMGALSGIDTAVAGLKAQDPIGNLNTIQQLQSTQQKIAQSAGFQQGPNSVQAFASLMGGGANAISGVLQAAQSGLDALAATQDIADRLVYGVRNTEDVMKLVDNVQTYITFASQVASAAGSVLSLAGSASGGMDMGGAAAAGQAAQMISGLLQGVNAAIDFSQMIYHITGSYVGKLLSQMVAGPLGTPLMGDVRFLLNTNTGYLNSYSQDNPGNQNSLGIPKWINDALGYGKGNPNPQVNQELNVYAGPGQPAHEMLREVVWMANTSGPATGAMAPANF